MECVKCDFCGRIWTISQRGGFHNGPHQFKGKYLDICDDCLKVIEKNMKETMRTQWEKYHKHM
jgi:hypothetical protein